MLDNKPKWSLDRFLKFNVDSSRKKVEVILNDREVKLTIKQFQRLTSTFQMSGSERVYKLIDGYVETIV